MGSWNQGFWNGTRYDRRFWAVAYAALAAFSAIPLLLDGDGASRIVRWLIVIPLVFNVLYTLWKWRREGRWIPKKAAE